MLPSSIGFGTYRLGGAELRTALETALALGYRHIDTAALYRNEAVIGEVLAESKIARQELYLTTKVHWRDIKRGRAAILREVTRSLQALQTGYVDLLLLHAPLRAGSARTREAWAVLVELRAAGHCAQIGVSNFDVADLDNLEAVERPPVNQIEIHPFHQQAELVAVCRARDIRVVAHSALARAQRLQDPTVAAVAARSGLSPAQVLIGWSLAKGYVPLVRSQDAERLAENLSVEPAALTREDVAALDALEERGSVMRQGPTQAGNGGTGSFPK